MASAVPFSRPKPLPLEIAKSLPQNLDAERALLGAILVDNATLKKVAATIVASDFFTMASAGLSDNGRIFLAMVALEKDKKPIEYLTIVDHLQADGVLSGYISSLTDGVARISNVEHYAKIIREKSLLRQLVHKTNSIQQKALEGTSQPDELFADFELFAKESVSRSTDNPMVVVGCRELLSLEMPPPEFLIDPLLTRGGTMLIFSWSGIGKSYITTEFAAHLAMGLPRMFCDHLGRGGLWPISRACRVLYLYGEMHGGEIKERFKEIAKGHRLELPEDEQLGFVGKEFQLIKRASAAARGWRPRIDSAVDRRIVEDNLTAGGYEILVLDNISTLWSASLDDASDREAILKNWFIDLNARGISIVALTHAGKSGDFLGDSQQIHILDSLLKLRRPANYKMEEQLRAEMKIEKLRHKASDSRLTREFEVQLDTTDSQLGAVWTMRPARKAQIQAAFEMFRDDMKAPEVAKEIAISPRTVYRYKKMYLENGDAKHWTDRETE